MRRHVLAICFTLVAALLSACTAMLDPQTAQLASEPLSAEPRARGVDSWTFGTHTGTQIQTQHFQIFTTIEDPVFHHLLIRVLEAVHDRNTRLAGFQPSKPLECYIFSSRGQWENYTRERAGVNAPIYLQISSGGYCQAGVFAGYDIGRDQTLSVIAHEAWHQYASLAFKNRLPSWLDEGMATQNEAIVWQDGQPAFEPEKNSSRLGALRQALRAGTLWKLPEMLSTHAGRVIKMPQANIDAYYAQLWSFTLFLQRSPVYAPRLSRLLADAAAGRLVEALQGTSVTAQEIDNFTEHWNTVAGPVYVEKYLNPSVSQIEREYLAWLSPFTHAN